MEQQATGTGRGARGARAGAASWDEVVLDDAIRQRLVAMTADFRNLLG